VIVEDIFFLSKIQQSSDLLGVNVVVPTGRDLAQMAMDTQPRAVILDLNHHSLPVLELTRGLKSNRVTQGIPVLGFLSHVQTDLAAAAREAGVDEVLPRSVFTQRLPQILRELSGERPARAG
jgi:CheY-like chemotaxis protein